MQTTRRLPFREMRTRDGLCRWFRQQTSTKERRKMNKKLNVLFIAMACLLMHAEIAFAQLPTPTYGWNLGNTLEPPCGEGCWAPAATQALINNVAASGFNTIRIPVAWASHANSRTHQIDPTWMARVKQVVDWSRAAGLTVII